MTTHPLAEFIIAFAQGKKVTTYCPHYGERVLIADLQQFDFPSLKDHCIEPDTITVNGVECVAPTASEPVWIINIVTNFTEPRTSLYFDRQEDRDTFYEALIKPFKEYLK